MTPLQQRAQEYKSKNISIEDFCKDMLKEETKNFWFSHIATDRSGINKLVRLSISESNKNQDITNQFISDKSKEFLNPKKTDKKEREVFYAGKKYYTVNVIEEFNGFLVGKVKETTIVGHKNNFVLIDTLKRYSEYNNEAQEFICSVKSKKQIYSEAINLINKEQYFKFWEEAKTHPEKTNDFKNINLNKLQDFLTEVEKSYSN